jgi:solute carrier family 13 (sodium-dependent dicarboxylate transporter), member 2/3/5
VITSKLTTGRRLAVFLAGWIILFIAWSLPLPEPIVNEGKTVALTAGGKICLGILALVVLFWVTEIMPFAITGFLALVLLHAFGVQNFDVVLAKGFGHPIAAFVIGILLFSLAVTKTGLGDRLTRIVLGRVGRNSRRVLFAFMATGGLLSAWMSDAAVAAILMPIAVGILRHEGVRPLESNFGRALLMSCVWGPSIGGIATPAGAAPNPLSLAYLHQMAGVERNFVDWMIFGVPAALVLLPVGWLILIRIFPPEMKELARVPLEQAAGERKPWSRGEWTTAAVFLLTVTLWVCAPLIRQATGLALSMEYVIFATVLLFFVPGLDVLAWTDVHRDFSWNALFLVMTGISIGFVLGDVGVAEWLSHAALHRVGHLPVYFMIVFTALLVALLHNLFASNTITAVVLVPIILHSAILVGTPPWLAVAPAAFMSTMGLVLVTTAPTNMIPYTAGYFSIRDFAKAGIVMSVVGSVVIGSVIWLVHVLFGVE